MKLHEYVGSILVGLLIGAFFISIIVYLFLRTGIQGLYGMPLFIFVLLTLSVRYSPVKGAIAELATRGAKIGALGVTTGYIAAVIMTKGEFRLGLGMLALITLVSTSLGVFLLLPFSRYFLDEQRFSWPLILPDVTLYRSLTAISKEGRPLLFSLLAAVSYTFLTNVRAILPARVRLPNLPDFMSISNSPLLAGFGFIIGWRGTLLVFLGSLYSAVVWRVTETPEVSFTDHIMNPAIFSLAIPMILVEACISIYRARRDLLTFARGINLPNQSIGICLSALSIVVFTLTSAVVFSGRLVEQLHAPAYTMLVVVPIILLSSLYVARSVAETGFWFSFSSEMAIILLAALLSPNLPTTLIIIAMAGGYEAAAVVAMMNLKFGHLLGVGAKSAILLTLLGTVFGSLVCVSIVYLFQITIGFGTVDLPAPFAVATGVEARMLLETIASRSLPPFVNPWLILAGTVVSFLLSRLGLSGVMIVSGLFLPIGFLPAMLLGALVSWYLERTSGAEPAVLGQRRKVGIMVASGFVAGEGIVSSLSSLLKLLVSF